MIWIRADANKNIGTGHVMRCLSVAAALRELKEEVCFILADENATGLLTEKGFSYKVLGTSYDNMEGELLQLCKWLKEEKPRLLLIDSYFVTKAYLEQVGRYVKTAYIDDVNAFSYPVDVLINYNIYGDMLPYGEQWEDKWQAEGEPEKSGAPKNMKFLLGTAYAPLRQEFCDVEYEIRKEARHVLITTGGGDFYNLAGRILEEALRHGEAEKLHYHVVSGVFNRHFNFLKELEKKHDNIHIHQNVAKMSELMQACDVAIAAGGSTLYELCAVGLPILCFSFAQNQEMAVQTFVQKGLTAFGGNYLEEKEQMTERLIQALAELAGSYEARYAFGQKAKALVDGHGAGRIAEILCKIK